MRAAVLALLVAGCAGNSGVRLIGATPAQQVEAAAALEELRVETGGAVDRYLSAAGPTIVTLQPAAYSGADGPGLETGSEGGSAISIYPLGQGQWFRATLVHELLHTEGLRHVADGPAVMSPIRRSARSCLRAEDVAELCRVVGCMHIEVPAPCSDEPGGILGAP